MRQYRTIAWNAFMELLRQPVFLLLMTCSSVFAVFLASTPYFGFGEDPKLVKDSVLAMLLLGEHLQTYHYFGIVLIFSGIYLVTKKNA